jgi:ATP/ADP translocase
MNQKSELKKGFKYMAITLPLLFLAPLLMFLGFKAIGRDASILGVTLVVVGAIVALIAIGLMYLGIKNLLDYLFEK